MSEGVNEQLAELRARVSFHTAAGCTDEERRQAFGFDLRRARAPVFTAHLKVYTSGEAET